MCTKTESMAILTTSLFSRFVLASFSFSVASDFMHAKHAPKFMYYLNIFEWCTCNIFYMSINVYLVRTLTDEVVIPENSDCIYDSFSALLVFQCCKLLTA